MATNNLSDNSLSWFDREFIEAKAQVKLLEEKVNADLRFPDHLAFKMYLTRNNKLVVTNGRSALTYVNAMTDPSGDIRLRFTLTETFNGTPYHRPVTAHASPDGKTRFILQGISY